MSLIITSLIIIALGCLGYFLYNKQQENEAQRNFFHTLLPYLITANNQFHSLVSHDRGCFANYQLLSWKWEWETLFNKIKGEGYENIDLMDQDVRANGYQ